MKGRLLLVFALAGLAAMAGNKSYTFTLFDTATVGNMEMKPGTYKVEVADQKAIIHNGKLTSEVPVKVETSDSKYDRTSVRISKDNGKYRLDEIHVGGTNTKLVLEGNSGAASGQ